MLKTSNWIYGNKKLHKSNKNLVENFANGLDQVEDKIYGLEDRVNE
jgi:hypothetical protein